MVGINNTNIYSFTANNKNQQHQYAHLIKENPFQKVASSVNTHAENARNLGKAIAKAEGSDYTLGRMNDTTIRMGSLGIATLASSLAYSKVSGINEFIGFACWFASMGLSPKIINKMVKARFGLDLDKEYMDSYGRRKKLFDDPGFIPWDLVPDAELYKIGDKMGVPKNIINRKEAIQEKIQQVVVQSKTWMMISAGVATPVFASLMADGINQLKSPIMNLFHKRGLSSLEQRIENAVQSGNINKAKKLLQQAVDNTFGMKEGSAIARMWQDTPSKVVKKTGIIDGAVQKVGEFFQNAKRVITGKQAWIPKVAGKASPATESMKIKAIASHLQANPSQAQAGAEALKGSISQVNGWRDAILRIMKQHPELQDNAMEQFVKLRARNLQSGFGNMLNALSQSGTADASTLSKLIKGLPDAGARKLLLEKGNQDAVLQYLGKTKENQELVKQLEKLFKSGQTDDAVALLSKRPIKFIDDAVKDTLLHRRWLKRIGGIGLGLLAATAIYTFFVMGKANKYNPKIKTDQANNH
jgi:hypothetical protein